MIFFDEIMINFHLVHYSNIKTFLYPIIYTSLSGYKIILNIIIIKFFIVL